MPITAKRNAYEWGLRDQQDQERVLFIDFQAHKDPGGNFWGPQEPDVLHEPIYYEQVSWAYENIWACDVSDVRQRQEVVRVKNWFFEERSKWLNFDELNR